MKQIIVNIQKDGNKTLIEYFQQTLALYLEEDTERFISDILRKLKENEESNIDTTSGINRYTIEAEETTAHDVANFIISDVMEIYPYLIGINTDEYVETLSDKIFYLLSFANQIILNFMKKENEQ